MSEETDRRTKKRKIGDLGEKIAETFLVKRGFTTICTNYLKKWGEIDIICKKGGVLYFVEVKTVSRETSQRVFHDAFRPEDNIHPRKIERMNRAIQFYIEDIGYSGDWEIIAVLIELVESTKEARVRILDDFAW